MENGKPFESLAIIVPVEKDWRQFITKSLDVGQKLAGSIDILLKCEDDSKEWNEFSGSIKKHPSISLVKFDHKPSEFVDGVLKYCHANGVKLLVISAEEREFELERYYEQSITRQLTRKSDCSILLVSDLNKGSYQKLILENSNHPKSKDTESVARHVARTLKVNDLFYAQDMLDDTKSNPSAKSLKVINDGYAISKAVKSSKSDLLILSSPDTKLGFAHRVFSEKFEYLISEPPTDILIIHSTRKVRTSRTL